MLAPRWSRARPCKRAVRYREVAHAGGEGDGSRRGVQLVRLLRLLLLLRLRLLVGELPEALVHLHLGPMNGVCGGGQTCGTDVCYHCLRCCRSCVVSFCCCFRSFCFSAVLVQSGMRCAERRPGPQARFRARALGEGARARSWRALAAQKKPARGRCGAMLHGCMQ